MFQHVDFYPGDPIFGLVDAYNKDTRSPKVNLSIGLYQDGAGLLPLLDTVKKAETARAEHLSPRSYLPMEGLAAYRSAVQNLLFGADAAAVKEGRIATVQTLGGSGALKIGADFLHSYFPNSECYVSDPTWANHIAIFEGAGIKVKKYPYYDAETGGVCFEDMLSLFKTLPKQTIVLLHPCCHNPTGVDLSPEQWNQVIAVVQERELIPFMDIAYQGFGDGLEEDVFAIRAMMNAGVSFFVSNSFSKNLSYYGERCGGLSVVSPSKEEADLVMGQLKLVIRRTYSNPPAHGAYITAEVMNNPALHAEWAEEVAQMRVRIKEMRQKLYDVLSAKVPGKDFSYFLNQRGMFSFTGLTEAQVNRLKDEFAIYLVGSGRMCVAGLNNDNVDYVASAFATVLQD